MNNLLDSRLNAAATLVPQGSSLLDIGSDHALLPISLLLAGKISFGAAADINKPPLEKGRKNAEKYGVLNNMEFYLSNGFENVDRLYNAVSICGMGGRLICDILENCKSFEGVTFILQPMTAAEVLREYLWQRGFEIETEIYAVSSQKPYAVLKAEYKNAPVTFDYIDKYLGKILPETQEFRIYAQKICLSAQKRLKGAICKGENTKDLEELIDKCRGII